MAKSGKDGMAFVAQWIGRLEIAESKRGLLVLTSRGMALTRVVPEPRLSKSQVKNVLFSI